MYNKVAQRKMLFEQATQDNLRQQVLATCAQLRRVDPRFAAAPPTAAEFFRGVQVLEKFDETLVNAGVGYMAD